MRAHAHTLTHTRLVTEYRNATLGATPMAPDQPRPANWQYTAAYPLSLTEADSEFQVSKFGRIAGNT